MYTRIYLELDCLLLDHQLSAVTLIMSLNTVLIDQCVYAVYKKLK